MRWFKNLFWKPAKVESSETPEVPESLDEAMRLARASGIIYEINMDTRSWAQKRAREIDCGLIPLEDVADLYDDLAKTVMQSRMLAVRRSLASPE